MGEQQKKCTGCGETKPLEAFAKRTDRPIGRLSQCRKCRQKYFQEYYNSDPEKQRNRARVYREDNAEDIKAKGRAWYAANAEKARKKARDERKEHPERCRERSRRWREANVEGARRACNAHQKKIKAENHSKIIQVFGPACLDCGREYPMEIFDYHHLDPSTKDRRLDFRWPWERVEVYIQGCVQLCPTCHRLRHHKERAATVK